MKNLTGIILLALMLCIPTAIGTAQQNKAEQLYQQALFYMEGKGDYAKAIESFTLVMAKFPKEKSTAAKALLNIGRCYEKLGKSEAVKAYERILKEFKDQTQVVQEARTRLALLKRSDETSADLRSPSSHQIWDASDANGEGAPSPNGRYLSYQDFRRNCQVIYDLKTKERRFLANPDSNRRDMYTHASAWSPDGNRLAYDLGDSYLRSEIHIINTDGTGHRTLCAKGVSDSTMMWLEDWSRDGKYILIWFSYWNINPPVPKYADLNIISVDDGSIRLIKRVDNWNWKLSHRMFFSPDSRFIAWSAPTAKGGGKCDVFMISVDGSGMVNISQNPANDIVLGWEPNGDRLLFASDRSGTYNLWAAQIVNGQPLGFPKLIMNNIGNIKPIGITRDGSFYYSVEGPKIRSDDFYTESNIYLASLDPQTGRIISPPVPATMNNNGFNHVGSWSPDGKRLLYYSLFKDKSSPKWFILSPETGTEKEVLTQFGSDSSFWGGEWFPDGKHLIFSTRMLNRINGIYKLEIETGKMMPLVTAKDSFFLTPSVSPDGKKLFFESNPGNIYYPHFEPYLSSIYSYDLETKESKLLFQRGKNQSFRGFRLSPNGGYLAFSISDDTSDFMSVIPSSGGERRTIFLIEDTTERFSYFSGIRWPLEGKYIYYVKLSERDTKFELYRRSVQGGTPEPIGLENEGLHGFSIRPDGRQIAFCAPMEMKTGVWVLNNVFAGKEEVGGSK